MTIEDSKIELICNEINNVLAKHGLNVKEGLYALGIATSSAIHNLKIDTNSKKMIVDSFCDALKGSASEWDWFPFSALNPEHNKGS